jgi:hypothetical protein
MTKRSELVLPPGTYAYSLDRANAKMSVLVGPLQNKLEEQESAVIWDRQKGRTVGCPVDRAVQPIVIVPADSYAVVTNPHVIDGNLHQPPAKRKTQVDEVDLQYGRAEHVPGPTALIPWPGQEIQVRKSFQLARDQYLRVELVADELSVAARAYLNQILALASDEAIGNRMLVLGKHTPVFTPPTGVTVIGNRVETARKLGPFEWARFRSDEGEYRYVRGPALAFPNVNETFDGHGMAVDLTKAGVHLRRLVNVEDGPAGEELFLSYFDNDDGAPHYWWPSQYVEELATIEPITIPEGGGIYVRPRGSGEVSIHKAAAPVLFDPLKWELVAREDSCFAPAVVVQDNEACEIVSPTGSRIVIGPTVTLLEYTEQEGERIKIVDDLLALTGHADTADGVSVSAKVALTRTLTGTPAEWFRATGSVKRLSDAIETLFRDAARGLTAAQVEGDGRLLTERFAAEGAFTLPGVEVSNVDVVVQFVDPDVGAAVEENRRTATANRLAEQKRQLEQQHERIAQQHAAAMTEMATATIERDRLVKLTDRRTALEAEKMELEAKKAKQDLLDEIATYELDREARRNQQSIEQRKREIELERQKIEAQATASVEVLGAIQPHLIEAVRAAGAQTSFSKVVQHLGPAAVLQGVGLTDALTKMVGNDAAAALLLTGTTPPDKPNGSSKRRSAEP